MDLPGIIDWSDHEIPLQLSRLAGVVERLHVERDASGELSMDYFSCTVDGVALRGGFYKVQFQEGDFIEFAVDYASGCACVHAARSPSLRILWMLPYRIRGHARQRICDIQSSVLYPTLAVTLVAICELLTGEDFGQRGFVAEFWFYFLFFMLTLAITVFIRRFFRVCAVETTEVLRAFGYAHPEHVDLSRRHRQLQAALAASTGTRPPALEFWSYRY